jgi:hypothetical protein
VPLTQDSDSCRGESFTLHFSTATRNASPHLFVLPNETLLALIKYLLAAFAGEAHKFVPLALSPPTARFPIDFPECLSTIAKNKNKEAKTVSK